MLNNFQFVSLRPGSLSHLGAVVHTIYIPDQILEKKRAESRLGGTEVQPETVDQLLAERERVKALLERLKGTEVQPETVDQLLAERNRVKAELKSLKVSFERLEKDHCREAELEKEHVVTRQAVLERRLSELKVKLNSLCGFCGGIATKSNDESDSLPESSDVVVQYERTPAIKRDKHNYTKRFKFNPLKPTMVSFKDIRVVFDSKLITRLTEQRQLISFLRKWDQSIAFLSQMDFAYCLLCSDVRFYWWCVNIPSDQSRNMYRFSYITSSF